MAYTFTNFPANWSGSKADLNVNADPTHYWGADEVNFLSQTVTRVTGAIKDIDSRLAVVAWLTSSNWEPDGGVFHLTGNLRLTPGSFTVENGDISVYGFGLAGDGNTETVMRLKKHSDADSNPGAVGDAATLRFDNNDDSGGNVTFAAIEGHVNDATSGAAKGRLSMHVAVSGNGAAASPNKWWFTPDGITSFNELGAIGEIVHSGTSNFTLKALQGGIELSASHAHIDSTNGETFFNSNVDGVVTNNVTVYANSSVNAYAQTTVTEDVDVITISKASYGTGDSNDLILQRVDDLNNSLFYSSIRIGQDDENFFSTIPLYMTATIVGVSDQFVIRENSEGGPISGTISLRDSLSTLTYEAKTYHSFYQQAGSAPEAYMMSVNAFGKDEVRTGLVGESVGIAFKLQDDSSNPLTAMSLVTTITDPAAATFKAAVSLRTYENAVGTYPGITVSSSRVVIDNGQDDVLQIRHGGVGNLSATLVTPAGAMILSASHGVKVSGALEITGTAVTTLYLHSPNGARWAVTCSNAGVLGVVAA
jgi:hypothetical protein